MRWNNFVPIASGNLFAASSTETVPYVSVQNNTGVNQTVQISFKQDRTGITVPLIYGTLTPYGSAKFDGELVMESSDVIVGVAGTANAVSAQIP